MRSAKSASNGFETHVEFAIPGLYGIHKKHVCDTVLKYVKTILSNLGEDFFEVRLF